MMLMLTESFSKPSTVFVDKSQDSKSEWPKFSDDIKKLCFWYLGLWKKALLLVPGIMAQISLPPWNELYDPLSNDIVTMTSNVTLNGKL